MNVVVHVDVLVVAVLTGFCIFFSVRSFKSGGRKWDSVTTITTAVLTFIIYWFADYNSFRQQHDLTAINKQQILNLKTDLGNKIDGLSKRRDSLQRRLNECNDNQNQVIHGNDNNANQQKGDNNTNNQQTGRNNSQVSGTGNTLITIQGSDGSTINYHPLDKPFYEQAIDINKDTNSGISVIEGEQIFIKATGSINVGPIVGSSGPDGRVSGFLGASLEAYNIIRNFNHAALMFKLSPTDDWIQCGSSYRFKASKSGELIFNVNDNDQGNNSGSYQVTIQKFKDK